MRTAVCLALSVLVACATVSKKSTHPNLEPWPEIRPDFRKEELRVRMTEYAITFAADVDLAASAIYLHGFHRAWRLLWKTRAIPEIRKACFRPEPVMALIDAWIFARQMDQL